jgi:hypothetical protein
MSDPDRKKDFDDGGKLGQTIKMINLSNDPDSWDGTASYLGDADSVVKKLAGPDDDDWSGGPTYPDW